MGLGLVEAVWDRGLDAAVWDRSLDAAVWDRAEAVGGRDQVGAVSLPDLVMVLAGLIPDRVFWTELPVLWDFHKNNQA